MSQPQSVIQQMCRILKDSNDPEFGLFLPDGYVCGLTVTEQTNLSVVSYVITPHNHRHTECLIAVQIKTK